MQQFLIFSISISCKIHRHKSTSREAIQSIQALHSKHCIEKINLSISKNVNEIAINGELNQHVNENLFINEILISSTYYKCSKKTKVTQDTYMQKIAS